MVLAGPPVVVGALVLCLHHSPATLHNSAFPHNRRELREIEATAVAFQVAAEEATTWEFDRVRVVGVVPV